VLAAARPDQVRMHDDRHGLIASASTSRSGMIR
jgi:hypothetical protein